MISGRSSFLLTPLREGRPVYNEPIKQNFFTFLLTPLREGRRVRLIIGKQAVHISTHAPAGGATGLLLQAEL